MKIVRAAFGNLTQLPADESSRVSRPTFVSPVVSLGIYYMHPQLTKVEVT